MRVLVPALASRRLGGSAKLAIKPRAFEVDLPEWSRAEAPTSVRWPANAPGTACVPWTNRSAVPETSPRSVNKGNPGPGLGTRWAVGSHWYPCLESAFGGPGPRPVTADRVEHFLNGTGSPYIDVSVHLEERREAADPELSFGDLSCSSHGAWTALDLTGWNDAVERGANFKLPIELEHTSLSTSSHFALIEDRLWVRGPEPTCWLKPSRMADRAEQLHLSARSVAGGRRGASISRSLNTYPIAEAHETWRKSRRPEMLLPCAFALTWPGIVGIGAAYEIASVVCLNRTLFPVDFVERSAAARVAAVCDRQELCAEYVLDALPEVEFLNLDRSVAVGFDRVVRSFVEMAQNEPIAIPSTWTNQRQLG